MGYHCFLAFIGHGLWILWTFLHYQNCSDRKYEKNQLREILLNQNSSYLNIEMQPKTTSEDVKH